MTDRYLSAVLEEAEQIATHHEQVAHSTENATHEYLRYAVVNYPTLLRSV
jgi:hypothetical protein